MDGEQASMDWVIPSDFLDQLPGVRTELRVSIGQEQRFQSVPGGVGISVSQLRLRQRKQIGRIFRLELDGQLQMLLRRRERVALDHLQKTEQFMRRPEARHQRDGFLEFVANLRRLIIFQAGIPVLGIRRAPILLLGINIMGQKTGRTALQRLLQATHCLIGFPALGGQQAQSFVRQRTGGRELLRQGKILIRRHPGG